MAKKAEEVKEEIIEEMPIEEETVTIRLPKERGTDEDVVVWVNDRRFLIKRGVNVDVPKCVAEVLENQERMLDERYAYEERTQK